MPSDAVSPDAEVQWVIATTFPNSGDKAYWGTHWTWGISRVPFRGDAHRFDSEAAALHVAYELKRVGEIDDFTLESFTPRVPRKSSQEGSSGRA